MTELWNCEILTPFLSVHLLSLLVLKFAINVSRSSLFAYMIFIKNNGINEYINCTRLETSIQLGGTVFYKHLFLVKARFWPQIFLKNKFWNLGEKTIPEGSHMPHLLKTRTSISFILGGLPWQRTEEP